MTDLYRVEIRQLVCSLGRHQTADQKLDLGRKRQRLAGRIQDFHKSAEKFLGAEAVLELSNKAEIVEEPDGNISNSMKPDAPKPLPSDVENKILIFPSQVASTISTRVQHLEVREL